MRTLLAAFAMIFVGLSGCGSPSGSDTTTTTPKKEYACPMKCATSDAPGKCPKCGMDMEEVR